MRTLISGLKSFTELLMLTLLLMVGGGMGETAVAQGFTNPGGGSGGFGGRPLITVDLHVNDVDTGQSVTSTRVPVNLAGIGPNPSLPYTRTLTAAVKQDGRLFPSSIQFDLAPTLASGALFDPEDPTQGFRSLPVESTSGLATAFFHASSTPGTVVITASAQDPNTGQVVSASIEIEVFNEARPPASITFTGPYVNAVLAGESRFGDPPIQDGSYSRVVSVVVNDSNGNPTNPNTQINFFLIDGPLTGYPNNPGAFFIAGSNGNPTEGQTRFRAVGGDFKNKGVIPSDWLMLDGRLLDATKPNNIYHTSPRRVEQVIRPNVLTIQGQPFNAGKNNRGTVPYIIGRAESAAILSPSFTNLTGVASTTLTYPVERLGQTAALMACTADMSICGILNTCDANGANCKSVYLGVTNGSDRTLTVSATSLGPNRSTDVRMCLRDVNFSPLPATEIRYDVGARGPATVTVNGDAGIRGTVLTGGDGCAAVTIASSGQIPGSQEIPIQFTSEFVATPATVTIRSPGAGKIDGLFDCQFTPTQGTGVCTGTLRLTDDEGSPMAGVLIAVGNVEAAGRFTITFDPAEGELGKTNDQGQVQVTVNMERPGGYVFPFQTASGGTASYTLTVTVPAPGSLEIALSATEAELGQPFSAALTATGGVPPYEWTVQGSLPPGLSLNGATGIISGTPTTEGAFSFVVQAKEIRPGGDTSGLTGSAAFTITVGGGQGAEPLEVTLTGPTETAINVPYSGVVSATGGTGPYTFAVTAGTLPTGVTLSSNGTLSGTPTTAGSFSFSVQATDSTGATGTGSFTLTVTEDGGGGAGEPLEIALNSLPAATAGTPYTTVIGTASGGTAPYTWTFENRGNLPPDIALSNNGVLSGTFGAAGTYNFVVKVTDASSPVQTGITNATITVNPGDGGGGGVTPTQLTLLTSSPDLPSAGQNPVTLTAIARDTGGVLLQDVTVSFQIIDGDGALQVVRAVTDETGTAIAELSTGGNKRNRTIQVGASAGGVTATPVNVRVIGTALTGSSAAAGTIPLNTPVKLTFSLKDSAGNGIPNASLVVASTPGAPGLPTTIITDSTGVAVRDQQFSVAGTYNISAFWDTTGSAFADLVDLPLTIVTSSDAFTITVVDDTTGENDVVSIAPGFGNITATWLQNGVPVPGATIELTANKGTITVLNPGGNPLNATISSTVPGPATITGTGTLAGPPAQSVSAQKVIQFVAIDPVELTLQANPSSIPANVPGATSNQSQIVATIRDANANPVANVEVAFQITQDVSGGSLTASTAKTNFSGQAVVNYIAGNSSTPENGVIIRATVTGLPAQTATLTVAGQQVFITLGTGNSIEEPDPTFYALPYSVLVNDISGLPVSGRTVTLQVFSTAYYKGFYTWNGTVWVSTITAGPCPNEDLFYPVGDPRRNNGILDAGEDFNNNGRLDPGNVATTSVPSVVTDASGFGLFKVRYAQQFANWVDVQLTARTQVGGTETIESENFNLDGIASDFNKEDTAPPGSPSPFGTSAVCTDTD